MYSCQGEYGTTICFMASSEVLLNHKTWRQVVEIPTWAYGGSSTPWTNFLLCTAGFLFASRWMHTHRNYFQYFLGKSCLSCLILERLIFHANRNEVIFSCKLAWRVRQHLGWCRALESLCLTWKSSMMSLCGRDIIRARCLDIGHDVKFQIPVTWPHAHTIVLFLTFKLALDKLTGKKTVLCRTVMLSVITSLSSSLFSGLPNWNSV